jgi:hypothetical protein
MSDTTTVPRTVNCGSLCVTNHPGAPIQQYPGGGWTGTAVSGHYGTGTLPFTGLNGFDGLALLLVAVLLVLAGASTRLVGKAA